jgi:hypothetical protein
MDASGSTVTGGGVYPVTYNWTVDRIYSRITNADDAEALASAQIVFAEFHSAVVVVPNNTFPSSADIYVTLAVNTSALNVGSMKQLVINITSTPSPSITISGNNQDVYVYSSVTLSTSISYPSCYTSLIPNFNYSANIAWTVQTDGSKLAQSTLNSWISSSTTQVNIPAFGMQAGYTYVFQATYTSLVDTSVHVTSSATITTLASAPVALFATAGGTYSRDLSTFVLNATQSYDPTCGTLETTGCNTLSYTYSCYYTSTQLSCSNFDTADSPLLYPDLSLIAPSDSAFKVIFTLDVYSSETKLSGSTSMTVYVLSTGTAYVAVHLQTVPPTLNPTDKQYLSGFVGTSTTGSAALLTVSSCMPPLYLMYPVPRSSMLQPPR